MSDLEQFDEAELSDEALDRPRDGAYFTGGTCNWSMPDRLDDN